jgi:type IV pilus assembly protein PilC
MLESIDVLGDMFRSNTVYRKALSDVQAGVARGQGLSPAMARTGLFTPMLVAMVKVGEESGELPTVLEQVASYYRSKVDVLLGRATGMMEPVIVVGMGGVVGLIMASVYMPMFEMGGAVKGGN